MTSASFPRGARLLSRTQFLSAQADGRRFAGRYVVLYECHKKPAGEARVGLTVSKKVSHLSVERNLVRRRLRHLGRLLRPDCLYVADIVLIAKPSSLNCTFAELTSDVLALYRKAGLLAADFQLESL